MNMERPEVHNARVCTRDGRDHYIASYRAYGRMEVAARDTPDEAFAWLKDEARRRDLKLGPIAYRAGDPGTPTVVVRP